MSGVLRGVCVIRVGWEVSGGRGLGKWIWSLWALLACGHVLSAKPLLSEPLQSAALLPHLDPSALDSTQTAAPPPPPAVHCSTAQVPNQALLPGALCLYGNGF